MNAVQEVERLGVSFRRYNAIEARQLADIVEAIYVESYVEAIASGHSFYSVDAFMGRFKVYSSLRHFDMVMACHDGEPIGQTWGWPRRSSGEWDGLEPEPDAEFIREDGRRTFVLSEIMVVRKWMGKRVAHALHDILLSARHEQRATLLVEPDNTVARRAYEHWRWTKVGQKRPRLKDAPLLDVMITDLVSSPREK